MITKPKLLRKSKRERLMEDVPMAPMIDVVFLLLIYFVFTYETPDILSRMEVHRPAPIHGCGSFRNTIGVHWNQDAESGFFTFNDQHVTPQALKTRMTLIANTNPDFQAVVQATANSYHRDLVFILDLMHDVGLKNVVLLSTD